MPLPAIGTPEWERTVDFMRADIDSGMKLSKVVVAARVILEKQGRDFDAEFRKWRKKNGKEVKKYGIHPET